MKSLAKRESTPCLHRRTGAGEGYAISIRVVCAFGGSGCIKICGPTPDVFSGTVSDRMRRSRGQRRKMQCKLSSHHLRRIARLLLILAAVPSLAPAADSSGIRLTAPAIGWILAPDGSQLIEITGIISSPRAGRAIALPSAARRSWASPDSNSVLLRLDEGLFFRSSEQLAQLAEIPAGISVAAAWDRSSTGFAICWAEICQARAANGAIREQWPVAGGLRVVVRFRICKWWSGLERQISLSTLHSRKPARCLSRATWL